MMTFTMIRGVNPKKAYKVNLISSVNLDKSPLKIYIPPHSIDNVWSVVPRNVICVKDLR